eukprot:4438492-Pyramimonas_sp.AAC.1
MAPRMATTAALMVSCMAGHGGGAGKPRVANAWFAAPSSIRRRMAMASSPSQPQSAAHCNGRDAIATPLALGELRGPSRQVHVRGCTRTSPPGEGCTVTSNHVHAAPAGHLQQTSKMASLAPPSRSVW